MLFDYTFRTVALGAALLGAVAGVVGCFAVLRGQSLLGDGISHCALPGIALAFLLTGSTRTEYLLLGALGSGLLAVFLLLAITRGTRVKFDAALALVLSVFFGLGMSLLTYLQGQPNSDQAGLTRFLFGQASALMRRDIWLLAGCGGLVLAVLFLCWKECKLFAFDSAFAESLGFPAAVMTPLLSVLMVVTILLGLQMAGVILMSALLVTPAAAARQWTNRLWCMVLLAAGFGAGAGVLGTALSSSVRRLPTGPAIVVSVSLFFVVSLLFAPHRGILYRRLRRRKNRRLQVPSGVVTHGQRRETRRVQAVVGVVKQERRGEKNA